jgi:hypothetical protein
MHGNRSTSLLGPWSYGGMLTTMEGAMPRDGKGLDPAQDVVTASEIAAFVYCEEQWRLQHGGLSKSPP